MENEIIGICGNGSLAELELIGNDPNFVFVNDVNFPTLVLFNDQGSVINVNSWIECANYVKGGWFDGIYDLINAEKYVFFASITFLIVYKMTTRFKKKTTGHEIH
jgi:hypothetical protein